MAHGDDLPTAWQHPPPPDHGHPAYSFASSHTYPSASAHTYPSASSADAPHAPARSPFEAPFDDHVYPAAPPPDRSGSQSTVRSDPRDAYPEHIPLRTAAPAKHHAAATDGETDHVYDAPGPPLPPGDEAPRGRRTRRGAGAGGPHPRRRIPWVTYLFTLVQVGVFVGEMAKNGILTGSPIQTSPTFNPMIGPSPYVLIHMGARFTPCMHSVDGIQNRAAGGPIWWPCPNTTSADDHTCSLAELCGFGMPDAQNPVYPGDAREPLRAFPNQPNQWFRFIIPIFLHAGLIHIGFNMLLQMTLGKEMEMAIGPIRFFLVYMCSGIFGFVLGGNFAGSGIASTGASGALFGVIALNLLDLLYTWAERRSPWKDFAFIMLDCVISFGLGLLPGLDNFSHIGGFVMGLVLGICILHSPNALRQRIGEDDPPYTPVARLKAGDGAPGPAGLTGFVQNPIGFFKGRKPLWWVWWFVRAGSLVFVLVVFALLLRNFYTDRKSCSWCKYLSCIDVNDWCDVGKLQLTNTTNAKRDLLPRLDTLAQLSQAL